MICFMLALLVVSGCGGTAQISEGGKGSEETIVTDVPEETTEEFLEETIQETPEQTTEAVSQLAATAKDTVEQWLIDVQVSTEERDAWILSFSPLNVRRFCYAKGTVIGSFDAGQKITVTGPLKYGFYPVRGTDLETGEEIKGYCSADYITFLDYSEQKIVLDIERYSQTDSRWSKIMLGTKYTLGEIGCTTTCFSMCESYLTGETITPADMSEMLTYTRGGDLYWPDGYQVKYGSDYLAQIYHKLHQGIPVLIGSRRNNGSQHWVLVTGYDPGEKVITKNSQLKASDFIINDPGKGRHTLAEFLKELPNVIKFVYYIGPESIYTQSHHTDSIQ